MIRKFHKGGHELFSCHVAPAGNGLVKEISGTVDGNRTLPHHITHVRHPLTEERIENTGFQHGEIAFSHTVFPCDGGIFFIQSVNEIHHFINGGAFIHKNTFGIPGTLGNIGIGSGFAAVIDAAAAAVNGKTDGFDFFINFSDTFSEELSVIAPHGHNSVFPVIQRRPASQFFGERFIKGEIG